MSSCELCHCWTVWLAARFVAYGMTCLMFLDPTLDCLRLKPKPPLWTARRLHCHWRSEGTIWNAIVWLITVWFPCLVSNSRRLVSESSVAGFRSIIGFRVKCNRSHAVLVFAKCIHALLLRFPRECHHADHPGAWCLRVDAEHVDIPGHTPEAVWQERTKSIDSNPEVGKLSKVEISWRRRVFTTRTMICGSLYEKYHKLGGILHVSATFFQVIRCLQTYLPQHIWGWAYDIYEYVNIYLDLRNTGGSDLFRVKFLETSMYPL